jgi:hypothetical protein
MNPMFAACSSLQLSCFFVTCFPRCTAQQKSRHPLQSWWGSWGKIYDPIDSRQCLTYWELLKLVDITIVISILINPLG